jgi:hypothetical protein
MPSYQKIPYIISHGWQETGDDNSVLVLERHSQQQGIVDLHENILRTQEIRQPACSLSFADLLDTHNDIHRIVDPITPPLFLIELLPDMIGHTTIINMMHKVHDAYNYVIDMAFEKKNYGYVRLYELTYDAIREKYDIPSLQAEALIKKVVDIYKDVYFRKNHVNSKFWTTMKNVDFYFKDKKNIVMFTLNGVVHVPIHVRKEYEELLFQMKKVKKTYELRFFKDKLYIMTFFNCATYIKEKGYKNFYEYDEDNKERCTNA